MTVVPTRARLLIGFSVAACTVVVGAAAAQHRRGGLATDPPPAGHAAMDADTQASGAMAHHHMGPSSHMKMTATRPPTDADRRRADEIVATLRRELEPYRDAARAERDGYKPFLPNLDLAQYHFTSWWRGLVGAFRFDAHKPTSLLYRRVAGRYELLGAMYTAPAPASAEQLDARVPLSIAQWHAHVNLCFPPKGTSHADWTRFGFAGSISTREACDAAGGRFYPQMFGWMVHVYPFETAQDKIWGH